MRNSRTHSVLAALVLLALATSGRGYSIAPQGERRTDPHTIAQIKGDLLLAGEIAEKVSASLSYSMFDDVNVRVTDGIATLTGFVTMSNKSAEFTKAAAQVRGIQRVVNQIETLPASMMDDALRAELAAKIYRDQAFVDHAKQRVGPVHIIVRDGMVTLTGVVDSEAERQRAGMIARYAYGTWSVDNQLRIEE